MTYDHWKTTNPADEFLGPDPDLDEDRAPDEPVNAVNALIERNCELARREGFAIAEIAEAIGFIEDLPGGKNDALYWAYKALVRAKDMLTNGSCE